MIAQILNLHPIVFHSLIVVCALLILAKSSDMLVYGISNYARKLGISDYLIGFIVISIGTALPEFLASLNSTLLNQGDLAFGVLMGSNLFKIPLLGIVILIARRIINKKDFTGNAPITTFIVVMAPLFLVLDSILSRVDGIILIMLFVLYMVKLWQGEGTLGKIKKDVKLKTIYKDGIIFIIALIALLLSARWLVFSSIQLSNILNISAYIVGLLVIGIGASAPELMVQIRSILNKRQNLAYGNVVGSLVANSALVLGVVSFIKPIHINFSLLVITAIFLAIGTIVTLITIIRKEVILRDGIVLIVIYALFLLFEWIF